MDTYMEKGQAYERQGDYVAALEQYKLAETMEPGQPDRLENIKRLEEKLANLAEAHYRAGLRFRDKGKWQLARKEFLQAIRYNPEHKAAAAMLQKRPPDNDLAYIAHTIEPGESLSRLSIKYYGDYRKYHHIANFNKLTDPTRVRAGQQIMIPAIPGVSVEQLKRIEKGLSKGQPTEDRPAAPPITGGETVQRPPSPTETPAAEASAPVPEMPVATDTVETEPVVDQVAEYRALGIALFDEKKYEDAVVELQKVLGAEPEDGEATHYVSRSYVALGRGHLEAERIDAAKSAFIRALNYDENCRECLDLLSRCRQIEGAALRMEGETLLREGRYEDAAAILAHALALNSDDALASDLLFQTHYQKAMGLFDEGKYLKAKTGFEAAVATKPDCPDCTHFIEACLEKYKERHYNAGIGYFGQEKLKEAISSWKKVVAVDPDYKDVQENLKKATLMDERIEMIRQHRGNE